MSIVNEVGGGEGGGGGTRKGCRAEVENRELKLYQIFGNNGKFTDL